MITGDTTARFVSEKCLSSCNRCGFLNIPKLAKTASYAGSTADSHRWLRIVSCSHQKLAIAAAGPSIDLFGQLIQKDHVSMLITCMDLQGSADSCSQLSLIYLKVRIMTAAFQGRKRKLAYQISQPIHICMCSSTAQYTSIFPRPGALP